MNKDLTPLDALEELKIWANNPYMSLEEGSEEEKELVGVIEKALKELEELKIENAILNYWLKGIIYYIENGEFTLLDLSKKLKALEIIKNKVSRIKWIGFVYKDGTNIFSIDYRETPTKEESDLLEEILE